jgi:hypothetical protein
MAQRKKKPVFKMTKEMEEYFRAKGREGGKVGGKLRWAGVSAEERSAHAKRAVAAREAKRAKKKRA